MREQLIQYVELLFAGGRDCEDIKQEILQNTLDRYDDLIAEGKVPEAAYRLAITGIGDINEILGTKPQASGSSFPQSASTSPLPADNDTPAKKLMRAVAVGLYILCPLPLILLSELGMDITGLCGTLAIVAVATVLIILGSKKKYKAGQSPYADEDDEEEPPKSELQKGVSSLVWALGLAVYFLWSFTTNAWHVTWVIFPILGAVDRLLMVLVKKQETGHTGFSFPAAKNPQRKNIKKLVWAVGIILFLLMSLRTLAWGITWLVIPITAAAEQLIYAILDYEEAMKHET